MDINISLYKINNRHNLYLSWYKCNFSACHQEIWFVQYNVCRSNSKNYKSKTTVKMFQSLCNTHGRHGGIDALILNLSIRKTRATTLMKYESRWAQTATGEELPSLKTLAAFNGLQLLPKLTEVSKRLSKLLSFLLNIAVNVKSLSKNYDLTNFWSLPPTNLSKCEPSQ